MKYLAIEKEKPGVTAEQYKPHLQAEAMRAWELYQAGVFREMYFDRDTQNAVIIMECNSKEEVEVALQTLPLVKEGLITFDVIALKPYSGFARLFA